MADKRFLTQSVYERHAGLSSSMEDYLEMTARLSAGGLPVRVKQLSQALNVSPSSASKMASAMHARGLVYFEKYGYITMTAEGRALGAFYMRRHDTVHRLLCRINATDDELEETEQIEHYLSPRTVENIEKFLLV